MSDFHSQKKLEQNDSLLHKCRIFLYSVNFLAWRDMIMRCLLSRFLGQWNESGWKSINHMSSEGWKKPLFRVSRFYYPAAIEQIKWYFRREKQAQQAADSTLPAAIPKQQQRSTTLPLLLACEQQWKNVKILFLGPCSTNIRFFKRFLKQKFPTNIKLV